MEPTSLIGYGGVLLAIVAIVRQLLSDRSLNTQLTDARNEHRLLIESNRRDIDSLHTQYRHELAGLQERLAILETKYSDERRMKHGVINYLAAAHMMLDIVFRLSLECECETTESIKHLQEVYIKERFAADNFIHHDTPRTHQPPQSPPTLDVQ